MEFPKIKIDDFEGPFDLLLHLIKKNKMSIYNVKIFDITNQYLGYLNEMKKMDLEITSEFIVVAATLIEIKSKHLLPKPKVEKDEEDTEIKLLEKLAFYKKMKNASNYLKEIYMSSGEVYAKKPEIIEDTRQESDNELVLNLSLLELYSIYNNLLEIYLNKRNKNSLVSKRIFVDKYKIDDKIKFLKEQIIRNGKNNFEDLVQTCECKLETIVTFLALLEMVKQRIVKVYQNNNFQNIFIERINEYGQ